ncbi:vitellogenin-6-like isoform X2 [Branchiostoma lanceolatum]|uniref:vitellogenin-6-like isoform X2 n=1 Tax=Branchiostoma lanceolatum TaxID=7740 RepID=UPI0034555C2A
MNRVLLLLLGLCLAQANIRQDRPVPVYDQGKDYVYRYEGDIKSGIPQTSDRFSGMKIQADVRLQFHTDQDVLMRLEKISLKTLLGELDSPEEKKMQMMKTSSEEVVPDQMYKDAFMQDHLDMAKDWWMKWWQNKESSEEIQDTDSEETPWKSDKNSEKSFSQEVPEQDMREFRKHLEKVIRFRYEEGDVKDIEARKDEPQWSVNFKRGILHLIKLTMDPRKSELLDRDDDVTPNTSYNKFANERIYRVMEDDVTGRCETLYNIRDNQVQKNIREIIKTKDYRNCEERSEHAQAIQSGFMPDEQGDKPKELLESSVQTRAYVIMDKNSHDKFMVKSVESRGQHVFQPYSDKGGEVITFAKQSLKLLESADWTEQLSEPEPSERKGGLMFVFDTREQNRDLTWNRYMRMSDAQKHDVTQMRTEKIQALCQDIAVDLNDGISGESTRKFMELVEELRNLHQDQLETIIMEEITSPEEHTQDWRHKNARKVLLDAVSLVGKKEALKVIQQLMEDDKVTDDECAQMLTGISLSIQPCPESVKNMLEIVKSPRSQSSRQVRQAAWLSLGTMVHGLLSERREGQLEKHLPENKETAMELRRLYSQELMTCMEDAQSDEEKLMCLKAMGNAGLEDTVDRLQELITGKESDTTPLEFRVEAIRALWRVAEKLPHKILNILFPVFNNPERDPEERTAAFDVVMASNPPLSVLEMIAQSTQRETSNQVGQYVYTCLKKLSESELPKDMRMKTDCKIALRLAKPFNKGIQYSQSRRFQAMDRDMQMGAALDINTVADKSSVWPRFASAKLGLHAMGYHMDVFETGVRVEGLQAMIDSLLGKDMDEKKGIFDYLKKKSQQRHHADGSWNSRKSLHDIEMEKIQQKLPVETRRHSEPRGHMYMKWFGNEIRFDQLNKDDMQQLIDQGRWPITDKEEELRHGMDTHVTKATKLVEASRQIPTQLGLPITLEMNSALLMTSDVNTKLKVTPGIFREDRHNQKVKGVDCEVKGQQEIALQLVGKMSVDCHVIQSGVALNAMMNTQFPLSGKMSLDLENKKHKMTIETPEKERELFVWRSEPFVFTEETRSRLNADGVEREDKVFKKLSIQGKKTQKWPNMFHTSYGREELGIEFALDTRMVSRMNNEQTSPFHPLTGPTELRLSCKPGLHVPWEIDLELQQTEDTVRHLSPMERLVFTEEKERRNEKPMEIYVLAKHSQHPRTMKIKLNTYEEVTQEDIDSEDARIPGRFRHGKAKDMEPGVSMETDDKMKQWLNQILRRTIAIQLERSPVPNKESQDFKMCVTTELEYPAVPEWRLLQDRRVKTNIDVKWGRDCSGNDKRIKITAKWQKSDEQRHQEKMEELQEQHPSSQEDTSEEFIRKDKTTIYSACVQDRLQGLMETPACRKAVEQRSLLQQMDIDVEYHNIPTWMKEMSSALKQYVYHIFFDRLTVEDIDVHNDDNKMRMRCTIDRDQKEMNVTMVTPEENIKINRISIEKPKIRLDFSKILKTRLPMKTDWSVAFPMRFPSTKMTMREQYMDMMMNDKFIPHCKYQPNDRIRTFDGVEFPYQVGPCDHILAKDASPEHRFMVLINKPDMENNKKIVKVFLEGKKIEMSMNNKQQSQQSSDEEDNQMQITIDGRQVSLPHLIVHKIYKDEEDAGSPMMFTMQRIGKKVKVECDRLGVTVETDGHSADVKISNAYRGKMAGLCGNFDGEHHSEYEGPSREVYSSPFDFGLSYRIPSQECHEQGKSLSVMRNVRITQLNEFNKKETCFSKMPVAQCPEGFMVSRSETRHLEFHCLPSELDITKKYTELHKTKPLDMMATKRTDRIEEVEAELECEME